MGGGTTIVEALVAGRTAVGCDINSLAVFVSQAKTISLSRFELDTLADWALLTAQSFNYRESLPCSAGIVCSDRTRNLNLPRARAIKKYLALALASCNQLSTVATQNFARCVLLNVGQWALNGRKCAPSLAEFRARLADKTLEMLHASENLSRQMKTEGPGKNEPILMHCSAEKLPIRRPFCSGTLADLVVTSPPYPGIHVLYHRWQVDGRRETPAPYWIANCMDGQGDAHYNFGSRKQATHDDYFDASLQTLKKHSASNAYWGDDGADVGVLKSAKPPAKIPTQYGIGRVSRSQVDRSGASPNLAARSRTQLARRSEGGNQLSARGSANSRGSVTVTHLHRWRSLPPGFLL